MIYLCTPYSHPLKSIREKRYREAVRITAELTVQGLRIFSPIVHSHPMQEFLGEKHFEFSKWKDIDLHFIDLAESILVVKMPGYETSVGVNAEVTYAQFCGKSVNYLDYVEEE